MPKHTYIVECFNTLGELVETLEFDSKLKLAIFFESGAVFGGGFYYQVSHTLNVH